VDQVVVNDELGERRFAGPTANDTVMTTWHDHETLEEALNFFVTLAVPTQGFEVDSSFRVVMCLANSGWAETATCASIQAVFELDVEKSPLHSHPVLCDNAFGC